MSAVSVVKSKFASKFDWFIAYVACCMIFHKFMSLVAGVGCIEILAVLTCHLFKLFISKYMEARKPISEPKYSIIMLLSLLLVDCSIEVIAS